jgi:hypothetical protein
VAPPQPQRPWFLQTPLFYYIINPIWLKYRSLI